MSIRLSSILSDFPSSSQQIELLESIEYIHSAETDVKDLLNINSITAFAKRYFDNTVCKYSQILTVENGEITCRAYINGKQVSEASARTFNHARTKAAILALQDRDFELLKSWMELHKKHLKSYLSV